MDNIFDFPSDRPTPRIEPEPEPITRMKRRQSLSSYDLMKGKRSLGALVERAFDTLDEAMISAEHATAIKAALGVLDRAGFGPRSTLDVNQTTVDLTEFTREQLAERAIKVANLIKERAKVKELPGSDGVAGVPARGSIIDVTPKPEPTVQ